MDLPTLYLKNPIKFIAFEMGKKIGGTRFPEYRLFSANPA